MAPDVRHSPFPRAGFRRHLDVAVFLIVWVLAVAPGVTSTRDLEWPYDADGFRDLAIAQQMRDGRWLSDPFYVGEAAWYNPLVPAAIAVVSSGLGLETREGFARLGGWVNALAPLAFWLCARRLLGVWPALFAVCGFLFLPGRPQPWASATYSPWFFPSITAQIPLYLGLFVLLSQSVSVARSLFLGVLLGLTFMAHTAAGLLLAALIFGGELGIGRTTSFARRMLAIAVPFGVAALVSAPFLMPLAMRYRFHVLNRIPGTWSDDGLRLSTLFFDLGRPGSFVIFLLLVWGAVAIWRTCKSSVKVVLAMWGVVATLGHWYASIAATSATLPSLVPAFHFFFLMRAWTWLLFGSGVAALVDVVARRVAASKWGSVDRSIVGAMVAVLFVAAVYPRYLGREAFTRAPALSRELAASDARTVSDWIRGNIPASAIVLADDEDALRVVGPAGRFVVSVSPAFSNPYVDYRARHAVRDRFFAALATGQKDALTSLRREIDVTHIVASADLDVALVRSGGAAEELFSAGGVVVFRLRF
jgi:hypothetical protein